MAEKPRGVSTFCEAAHPSQALAADTGRYCRPLGVRREVSVCRRERTALTRVTRPSQTLAAVTGRYCRSLGVRGEVGTVQRCTLQKALSTVHYCIH